METDTQAKLQIVIVGDTYPHRQHLKSLGFRWSGAEQGWIGRQDQIDHLPAGCGARSLQAEQIGPHPDSIPCPYCGTYDCEICPIRDPYKHDCMTPLDH